MMDVGLVALSAAAMGGLGALFAAGLAVADRFLRVEDDPRIAEVLRALPGLNCGACGYPGCHAAAEAMVAGRLPAGGCLPGGAATAARVAKVLGADSGDVVDRRARVLCAGTSEASPFLADYRGVRDCRAAALLAGGVKKCPYGCLGLGTCERVCPFDAIHVGEDGLARVDEDRCTGCGLCVKACPVHVITLVPVEELHNPTVLCSNPEPGKSVRAVCSAGCIGCRQCVKVCAVDAISMREDLAVIDPAKCVDCGACVEKCPVHVIRRVGRTAGVEA